MLQTTPVYPNPSGLAVPPAGGTPYAGSPPVSAAPMPNQPLSVLGGRRLTGAEQWSVRKILRGTGTIMCVLASVLAGFIALVMLINLSESRYFPEGGILLLIAALIFGGGMTLFQWQQRRILERAIRFNEGESEERAVEIYADRMVSVSADRRITIFFSQILRALETPEMFLFFDREGRFIALRAADLTPFDAQRIRELVWPRLVGGRKEWKGYLLPRLQKPRPIPVFEWEIPMEPVSTVRGITRLREYIPQLLSSLPLFASLGLMVGTGFADEYWMTPSYIADALLFALMVLAGAGLFMTVFLAVVLRGRKTRQIREGTLPLRVGLTNASCLIGNLRYMIRLPRNEGLVRKTRKGVEIWACTEKRREWVATLTAEEASPAMLEKFLQ